MMDTTTTTQALRILRALAPGQHPDISQDTVDAWAVALQEFPPYLVIEAATTYGGMMFPAREEFLEQVRQTVRAAQAAERDAYSAPGECPECGGALFVMLEDAVVDTVRPCSRCRPEPYWLWSRGHYRRDHTCSICSALKRNDRKPLQAAMAGAPAPVPSAAGPAADF